MFFSSFLSISSVLPEGNKKDRDKKAVKEKGLTKTTSGGPRGPGKLYFSLSYSSFSSSSVRPVMEVSLFEVYLLFDCDLPFVFFFSKLMNEILTFEHSVELSLFHEILCCGILL